jgi:hypothetical protein
LRDHNSRFVEFPAIDFPAPFDALGKVADSLFA